MTVTEIIACLDRADGDRSGGVRSETCRDCGNGFDLPSKSRYVRCPSCRQERAARTVRRDRGVARPLVKLTPRRRCDAGVAGPGRKQAGRR